jgi:hypothetical protein
VCAARSRDGQGGRERRSRDGRFVETEREREHHCHHVRAESQGGLCGGVIKNKFFNFYTHKKQVL